TVLPIEVINQKFSGQQLLQTDQLSSLVLVEHLQIEPMGSLSKGRAVPLLWRGIDNQRFCVGRLDIVRVARITQLLDKIIERFRVDVLLADEVKVRPLGL